MSLGPMGDVGRHEAITIFAAVASEKSKIQTQSQLEIQEVVELHGN